VLDSVICST